MPLPKAQSTVYDAARCLPNCLKEPKIAIQGGAEPHGAWLMPTALASLKRMPAQVSWGREATPPEEALAPTQVYKKNHI